MTEAADIMAPLGATILGTRSLGDAARMLTESDPLVVLNLSYRAVGLITEADLAPVRRGNPSGWAKKRCACLVRSSEEPVQPHTRVEELLAASDIPARRPLLVMSQEEPVGIIRPEAIRRWQEQRRSQSAQGSQPAGG